MTQERNRPAQNPGGIQCERCDEIFIGEEWHRLCALCVGQVMEEIRKRVDAARVVLTPEAAMTDRPTNWMADMHLSGLRELGVIPAICQPCEGRGYFDSRHPGYRGHTTCSWCNGTGKATAREASHG